VWPKDEQLLYTCLLYQHAPGHRSWAFSSVWETTVLGEDRQDIALAGWQQTQMSLRCRRGLLLQLESLEKNRDSLIAGWQQTYLAADAPEGSLSQRFAVATVCVHSCNSKPRR
jgi:hypothetical protein